MSNLQRLEAACGLVAALLGFPGLAFALFGPVYRFESSSGQSGTANLLQVGIQPSALIALCILSLGLIGVAVSAVVHSRTGGRGWRIVLWIATAVIVILTLLSLPSIGVFLLPSTPFALLASTFSLGTRRTALS
jgi:phosphoglycerol transferase MdoB-like AlkP superfamily enzyme